MNINAVAKARNSFMNDYKKWKEVNMIEITDDPFYGGIKIRIRDYDHQATKVFRIYAELDQEIDYGHGDGGEVITNGVKLKLIEEEE